MKFVSGVRCDEAFHQTPNNATHRQDARSWCVACVSTRPPPDRIKQDAWGFVGGVFYDKAFHDLGSDATH
jgi:hypothetical protein